jgi:hypothetical protein
MTMQALVSGVDPSWIAACISALTFVGTIGVGGIMWGRLTERVQNITKRIDVHRTELDDHEKRLNATDRDLERLKTWKEIYSAGQDAGRHEPRSVEET